MSEVEYAEQNDRCVWLAEGRCPSDNGWLSEWAISNPCVHGGHIRRITKRMAAKLLRHMQSLTINRHSDEIAICYAVAHPRYTHVVLRVRTA
jgi:hypothetical protein